MNKGVWTKCFLLAMALVIVSLGFANAEAVTPRYTYTTYVTAGLKFSDGRAYSTGSIFPYDLRTTSIEVRLQQYIDNDWRTIGLWTGSNSSGYAEAGGSEEIDTGFTYRTYSRGKVYDADGNLLETVNFYSDEKFY